jgi:hypothetical protein
MVDPKKQKAKAKANLGYRHTQTDFEFHLNEQLQCLINAVTLFDTGYLCEAKKMATIIRVLLHDTSNSTSLLTHLGKKDSRFYDSSDGYDPKNAMPTLGLVQLILGNESDYQAKLGERKDFSKVPFSDWWNTIVMTCYRSDYPLPEILDKSVNYEEAMHKISRFRIIYDMANKDGGAHVDTQLDQFYSDLTKYSKGQWVSVDSKGKERDLPTPIEYCAVRQISHEVILTIQDLFPYSPFLPIIPRKTHGSIFSGMKHIPA